MHLPVVNAQDQSPDFIYSFYPRQGLKNHSPTPQLLFDVSARRRRLRPQQRENFSERILEIERNWIFGRDWVWNWTKCFI